MPSGAVVVFTRDLRVDDHPALAQAVRVARRRRPAVRVRRHHPRLGVSTDRTAPGSCSSRSPISTPRCGRSVGDSSPDAATGSTASCGWRTTSARPPSTSATTPACTCQARLARLESAAGAAGVDVHRAPGMAIVEPGVVTPGDAGDHYKVFTRYYRRWSDVRRRAAVAAPPRIDLPPDVDAGTLPVLTDLVSGDRSPDVVPGGARAAHRQLDAWVERALRTYPDRRDDLPGDATSRLSPYLHFGCVSPLEVARAAGRHKGADAFLRQLCWRDFYLQILAARPDAAWSRLPAPRRPLARRSRRRCGPGRRGAPATPSSTPRCASCDTEGFMHNRARHDRGVVPHQGPLRRLARRRPSLPRPPRSTATSPTTTSTGSGWPARAPTPTRTACSTRPCRAPGSTPRATTCGATCPSYAR